EAEVISLEVPVDPESRRVLLHGADTVLANSDHEPFGLVGLEAMAAGGLACTGISGEDYAVPGRNALVLQTSDPREFVGLYRQLIADPAQLHSLREAGRATAAPYSWPEILERELPAPPALAAFWRDGTLRVARLERKSMTDPATFDLQRDLDQLCVDTIRTLSMDAVQRAASGHPGTPMAMAPVVYALWQHRLRF